MAKLKDGTKIPSVTTVLGLLAKPALYYWNNKQGLAGIDTTKSVNKDAMSGTLIHKKIETQLLHNTEYVLNKVHSYEDWQLDCVNKAMTSFMTWFTTQVIEEPHLEMKLVSETYKYSGTIDIYCKLNGVFTLIDIKTSGAIYKDQLLQVSAYKQLLKENNYPIEQVMILSLDKYESAPAILEILKDEDDINFFKLFLGLMQVYDAKKSLGWK